MQNSRQTLSEYDMMKKADDISEDAYYPEEWEENRTLTEKEKYFDYYDDIKTTPKDDW